MNRISALIVSLLLFVLHAPSLLAQGYEGSACTKQNAELKRQLSSLRSGGPSSLSLHWAFLYGAEMFSSSYLKAEGAAPVLTKAEREDPLVGTERYDAWTCMYSAYRAQDNDTKTAWSEGVPGAGIGELLMIPVGTAKQARIWIGFGKTTELFKRNNRPKRVRLTILQAYGGGATQMGMAYSSLKYLASTEVDLADTNGWQTIALPDAPATGVPEHLIWARLLVIEILDVYKGTHYDDTLISEVQPVENSDG